MDCLAVNTLPGCWTTAAGFSTPIEVITEYRQNSAGEIVPYKIRYTLSDGTIVVPDPLDTVTYGTCEA